VPGVGFPAEEWRGGEGEVIAGRGAIGEAVEAVEGGHVHTGAVSVARLAWKMV